MSDGIKTLIILAMITAFIGGIAAGARVARGERYTSVDAARICTAAGEHLRNRLNGPVFRTRQERAEWEACTVRIEGRRKP